MPKVKINDAMKKLYQITDNQPASNKMAISNSHITILTLSVNSPNAPIKTQSGKLDKKSRPISALYSGDSSCAKTHID